MWCELLSRPMEAWCKICPFQRRLEYLRHYQSHTVPLLSTFHLVTSSKALVFICRGGREQQHLHRAPLENWRWPAVFYHDWGPATIFLLHVCWKTGRIRVWWCRLQNVDQPWTKTAARWPAHLLLRAAHAQVPPLGNARRWGVCCRKFP